MELPSDITWSQVTIQLAKRFCVSGMRQFGKELEQLGTPF